MDWSWGTLGAITVVYWAVTIGTWIARHRRHARAQAPAAVVPRSDGGADIAFEGRLDLRATGAVLFGPPLLLAILRIVTGS